MSAIVPSEIVRFIDRVFPDMNQGYGVEYSGLYLGLVTMVDQLDPSMLPADPQLRSELTAAISHLRFQVQIWTSMGAEQIKDYSFVSHSCRFRPSSCGRVYLGTGLSAFWAAFYLTAQRYATAD